MKSSSIIDIPKKASDKDQLGIDAYKNGLSNFIKTAQTPITIAIQGEWGSGKTSLMNSINHDLSEKEKHFHSVWINTWEYSLLSDEHDTMLAIIQGIINSVIEVLERDKNHDLESLKKASISFFKKAAKVSTRLAVNAVTAGTAGEATDELFESTAKSSSIRDLHHELQSQINKSINQYPGIKGFLFFIDDLDRINPPVAVKILELLKNLFDLENCIFVLAIDYDVVVKGLEPKFGPKTSENEREFRSFFEKIIQLPFTMPVGQYKVNELIIDNLRKLDYFEENTLTAEIEQTIIEISNLTVGSNPRAIKRLLNSLSLVRNIMLSVAHEEKPTAFEQLINIGVFSIQISYPYVFRVLERYPDFESWGEEVADSFKLPALNEDTKNQLSKNEYFNDEWEQILYSLCQKDAFLNIRAMQISRLLNTILKTIEKNRNEAKNNLEDVSVLDVMTNAIQIASVTSYDDVLPENKVKEIHKSSFLKHLRHLILRDFIKQASSECIKIEYKQNRVQSNLIFTIIKGQHHHRFDISIHTKAKYYLIQARFECWYFVKDLYGDFLKNLEGDHANSIKAKERFNLTLENLEKLKNNLSESYQTAYGVSTNDKHNTVNFSINCTTPNAWLFLENKEAISEYIKNLIHFLKATEDIKIGL